MSQTKLNVKLDAAGNVVSADYAPVPLTATTRTFVHPELTGFDESTGIIEAAAVTYGVTDTYNTRFLPGCFNEWLTRDLEHGVVPLVWSHNHAKRVGRLVDFKDAADKLVVVAQLDNPDTAPESRQPYIRKAWAALRQGILDEVSVAVAADDIRTSADGATEFVKARMVHLGLVLEGAVPGAVVLGVRDQLGPKIPDPSPSMVAATSAGGPAPMAPQLAFYARLDRAYELAGLDPVRAPDPVDEALADADAALALVASIDAREAEHLARMLEASQVIERTREG